MEFRKYELTDADWMAKKATLEITDAEGETYYDPSKVVAVHEIGHICTKWGEDAEGMPVCEIESPMYAVDILWTNTALSSFASNLVWPEPCGVHIFAGWAEQYAKDYCVANPSAAYCQPPTPPSEL